MRNHRQRISPSKSVFPSKYHKTCFDIIISHFSHCYMNAKFKQLSFPFFRREAFHSVTKPHYSVHMRKSGVFLELIFFLRFMLFTLSRFYWVYKIHSRVFFSPNETSEEKIKIFPKRSFSTIIRIFPFKRLRRLFRRLQDFWCYLIKKNMFFFFVLKEKKQKLIYFHTINILHDKWTN